MVVRGPKLQSRATPWTHQQLSALSTGRASLGNSTNQTAHSGCLRGQVHDRQQPCHLGHHPQKEGVAAVMRSDMTQADTWYAAGDSHEAAVRGWCCIVHRRAATGSRSK